MRARNALLAFLDAVGADTGAVIAFTVAHGTIAALGAALWQRGGQP